MQLGLMTETMWYIATQNPTTDKFELWYSDAGIVPHSANEEYDTREELEASMIEVAPLSAWTYEAWNSITE